MLDGVVIQLSVNSFQQKRADVFLDELISEIFVETQISEIPAALSIVFQILSIFQHINHEVDGVSGGYHGVAVENLGDMSQASGGIQGRLLISGVLPEPDNGFDNV